VGAILKTGTPDQKVKSKRDKKQRLSSYLLPQKRSGSEVLLNSGKVNYKIILSIPI